MQFVTTIPQLGNIGKPTNEQVPHFLTFLPPLIELDVTTAQHNPLTLHSLEKFMVSFFISFGYDGSLYFAWSSCWFKRSAVRLLTLEINSDGRYVAD